MPHFLLELDLGHLWASSPPATSFTSRVLGQGSDPFPDPDTSLDKGILLPHQFVPLLHGESPKQLEQLQQKPMRLLGRCRARWMSLALAVVAPARAVGCRARGRTNHTVTSALGSSRTLVTLIDGGHPGAQCRW